jgi:hypothetical protein
MEEDIKWLLGQLALCDWAHDEEAISRIALKYGVACPSGYHDGKTFSNPDYERKVMGGKHAQY